MMIPTVAMHNTNIKLADLAAPLFIVGAAHSGKSELCLKNIDKDKKIALIGTAPQLTNDLKERIEQLKALHPAHTTLIETPEYLSETLSALLTQDFDEIVIDSLNQWLSYEIVKRMNKYSLDQIKSIVMQELKSLTSIIENQKKISSSLRMTFVSAEVSAGPPPPGESSRLFRQLSGIFNQQIATASTSVVWVCCGIPSVIKTK